MPRPPRRIEPGLIYHVLNRGNARARVFRKEADYQAFVDILCQGLTRFRVELLAWCIMPNHWHLVLRPLAEGQMQAFMQWVTLTHVRRHHGHHGGRSGHLYQGRYKHFPVEEDSYFLTLCRYVESNALRAKLVTRAEQWRWSSLRQRIDRRTDPALGAWPVDRPGGWTALVNEAMPPRTLAKLREHVIRDRPLGEEAWMRKVARKLGLTQTLNRVGRPRQALEALSPRQRRRRQSERVLEQDGHNGT